MANQDERWQWHELARLVVGLLLCPLIRVRYVEHGPGAGALWPCLGLPSSGSVRDDPFDLRPRLDWRPC